MVRRVWKCRTVEETLRMTFGKKDRVGEIEPEKIGIDLPTKQLASPVLLDQPGTGTSRPSSRKHWIRQELFSLAVVLAAVTAARSSLADHYYVPSGSMENSLIPGDRVFVDKTAYGFRIPLTKIDLFGARTPERGEIAVFDSPRDGTRLIKRIVAIGGDVVTLVDGRLTINGKPLGDEHLEHFGAREALLNLDDGGGPDLHEYKIPPGMVLAIGDHRGNSLDGRFFGPIPERELFGRAVGVYYRRGEGFVWKPL
jgi:signal peptidase I